MPTTQNNLRNRKPGDTTDTTGGADKEEYEKLLKKRGQGEGKFKKFMTRLVFGLALVAWFFALLYSSHIYIIFFISFCQLNMFRELVAVRFDAEKDKGVPMFRTIQWCWFLSALFLTYSWEVGQFVLENEKNQAILDLAKLYVKYHSWLGLGIGSSLFSITILHFKKGFYTYQMGQLTWTVLTIFCLIFILSRVVSLVFSGLFWYMLSISLVVCNDTFAYFCGFFCGKKIIKRSFLTLSPNKTWEGFIGGGLCTVIFSFFWPTVWTDVSWVMCPAQDVSFTPFLNNLSCELDPVFVSTEYAIPQLLAPLFGASITLLPVQLHCVALACYASVFAPFGGFFASAIKRAYNKKDFASFIPGHGGFTDRFDCQFLMFLCTSVHLNTFVRSQVTQVMTSIFSMSDEQQREIYDKLGSHLSV